MRFLTEEEKQTGRPGVFEGEKIHRMLIRMGDFLTHSYTEGCPRCQSALAGTSRQGHSEKYRARMEEAVKSSVEGAARPQARGVGEQVSQEGGREEDMATNEESGEGR